MDKLRIFVPGGGEPVRGGLEPEPVPITYELIRQETPDGSYVDQVVVWRNEDAARCRWCPEGECTFRPTSHGIGTCHQRRRGGLAALVPAALRLRG
jgi:hypothetical protein